MCITNKYTIQPEATLSKQWTFISNSSNAFIWHCKAIKTSPSSYKNRYKQKESQTLFLPTPNIEGLKQGFEILPVST